MSEEDRKLNKWSGYAMRICVNAAAHPFEYAKILIQVNQENVVCMEIVSATKRLKSDWSICIFSDEKIGYEPIPPQPTHTFFGKPALKLPNIFQYGKHTRFYVLSVEYLYYYQVDYH